VYGESRNRTAANALADLLRSTVENGTLYLGYPVLATADERVDIDALLVNERYGLVGFLFDDSIPTTAADWNRATEEQDRLFAVLESHLSRHQGLRIGRKFAAPPNTATVFPSLASAPPPDVDGYFGDLSGVLFWLESLTPINPDIERALHAALQRVATIKPAKRRALVQGTTTRGAILKEIEKGIANLDRWQKAAAIESPEGPQRIRGLAGSGKTVVLALKAAYWHTQHPDWLIGLTFHSRALYQQIDDLVTRFTFEHSNDQPDRDYLRIVHSWGSRSRPGIYSMIANALGETPRDYSYARGKYGMEDAFQGICQELLEIAQEQDEVEPFFDAVLIDEAQDLPPEFFRLVYMFTKDPKRIVWGYDELQKLSEAAMPTTDELFGTGTSGESLVSLVSAPNSPRRDIVLPICYRNTPWALATAHALGIGVYRAGGLLQHPDQPSLWRDIGYNVVHGELTEGSAVTLERSAESYPPYFPRLLNPNDAVIFRGFADEGEQDSWIADQIAHNLADDELEEDDILVVLPDTYRAKSRAPRLKAQLRRRNIASHLVGVDTTADSIFKPESIAIAHIYRAKGNEAPMVYAIDAQFAAVTFNAVSRRNMLFTAITRSRAWVRICGWGETLSPIQNEVRQILEKNYQLQFNIPTADQLRTMRHVHRERAADEEASVLKATEGLSVFLNALESGEIDIEDLPPAMRTKLANTLQLDADDDDA
jgi:superfamily I DNA and RNA helicase